MISDSVHCKVAYEQYFWLLRDKVPYGVDMQGRILAVFKGQMVVHAKLP